MEMKSKNTRIIIADSSAIISSINPKDSNHGRAIVIAGKFNPKQDVVITPGDVYSEVLDTLNKKISHVSALRAHEVLSTSPLFVIVESFDLYKPALEKFKQTAGEASFTDCVVMATADRYQTNEIFGFDGCFKAGGYTLPLSSTEEAA